MYPHCYLEEWQAMESALLDKTEANKQDDEPTIDTSTSSRTSKIQFDLDATIVHEVCNRDDLTPEDLKILFYRHGEYASISSWNRMTLKIFRQRAQKGSMIERSSLDDDGHCIRGLEHRQKSRRDIRQQMITDSIYAVLDEQTRHRRENCFSGVVVVVDADKVAEAYSSQTYRSHVDAYEMGLKDELTVKELDKPREELPVPEVKEPEQRHGQQRRRGSLIAKSFDDSDLGYVKDDDSAAGRSSLPRMTKSVQKDEEQEESFQTKAKREGRFKRFFRRASITNKTSPSKTIIEKPAAPQPIRPRRNRRSSM
jgi:hypothetical protein